MCTLRTSGHLLQLLPKSPLSKVPDKCTREVAARPGAGTAPGVLFPSGLQRAAHPGPADLAEQEDPVLTFVRSQCRYAAGGCRQSGPSRRRPGLRALREALTTMANRVRQVVKQAKARIFDGITQL